MKYEDNCIIFQASDAALYDETRPFMPSKVQQEKLSWLCSLLQECARPNSEFIELADLGAGTGRIALPLARQYARYRQSFKGVPRLRITCVDRSTSMLARLKEKWASEPVEVKSAVEIVADPPIDIRDLGNHTMRYDAAIAHWIFHLIEDWRLAAYSIDRALVPGGRLLLVSENSSLYSAIDGDSRSVSNPKVSELWRAFYAERIKFDARAPRFRLGTLVEDERIGGMFEVLGWLPSGAEIHGSWQTRHPLSWVIDRIIEPRSFTNMQLYPDIEEASTAYRTIANQLRNTFASHLAEPWVIQTDFSLRVLRRSHEAAVPSRQVLLDVARATLALRRQQPLQKERSIVPVWGRLLRETWRRLNMRAAASSVPLGALVDPGIHSVEGTFLSAPSAASLRKEECTVAVNATGSVFWQDIDKVWDSLTSPMEVCEPFAICVGLSEAELSRVKEEWLQGARVHPPLRLLCVGAEAAHHLAAVGKSADNSSQLRGLIQGILDTEPTMPRWGVDLLHDAARLGLLPYSFENVAPAFLAGISSMIVADVPLCYAFPSVPARDRGSIPALGLLVACSTALDADVTTVLWLLGETLLSDFLSSPSSPGVSPAPQHGDVNPVSTDPRVSRASPLNTEELAERAAQLLVPLTEVPLNHFRVIGDYVRYDKDTLNDLRHIVTWIKGACDGRSTHKENMLLWAPSGQGKTFLIEEVARTIAVEFKRVDLKNQQLTEATMRQTLEECRSPDIAHLCLVDEIDNRLTETWPFSVLFEYLDMNQSKGKDAPNDVFVLVGSTPDSIEAMEAAIAKAHKGPDLLSRLPKRGVIPPFSLGDRLLIVLSQLRRIAKRDDKQVIGIEKIAAFYILCHTSLLNAHHLSDFIGRGLARMKTEEQILILSHLFDSREYEALHEFLNSKATLVDKLKGEVLYLAD